jgi:hypothetical protein
MAFPLVNVALCSELYKPRLLAVSQERKPGLASHASVVIAMRENDEAIAAKWPGGDSWAQ